MDSTFHGSWNYKSCDGLIEEVWKSTHRRRVDYIIESILIFQHVEHFAYPFFVTETVGNGLTIVIHIRPTLFGATFVVVNVHLSLNTLFAEVEVHL